MTPEFWDEAACRVAFDWATRRKPLAGRTLWMLEPVLVLMAGCVELKEESEGGRLRLANDRSMRLQSVPNGSSTLAFAAGAHNRVGVQLHIGAPTWSADYELSKNLHWRSGNGRTAQLAVNMAIAGRNTRASIRENSRATFHPYGVTK